MEYDANSSARAENEGTGRPIGTLAREAFANAIAACATDGAELAPIAIGVPKAEELLQAQPYEYDPDIAALIAELAGRHVVWQRTTRADA